MVFDLLGDYTLKRERRTQAFLETAFRFRGGLVLSYRWFVLGVGFGRSDWRRFRLIISLVGVRCWFWTFRLAVASSYPIVGWRRVLVLDVPIWRRLRLIISLVRVRCWFRTSRLAVVSSYPFLGAP